MRAFAASLLLIATPLAAQTPAELAGTYDGGQAEIAAGLELAPDGRFHYAMIYGAAEEAAEGRWSVEEGVVYLETQPAVKPPGFTVESDEPAAGGGLFVSLADPGFDWGTPLEVLVRVEGADKPYMTHADDLGRVAIDPAWRITGISPAIPVYAIVPAMHSVTPGEGRRLRFRFEPNDLGRADFKREPLRIEDDALLLDRFDRTLRFQKLSGGHRDAVRDCQPGN